MSCETIIEDARWSAMGLPELAESATAATLAHFALSADCEIVVLGCDDARIAALNADFRDKAGATNVLSWPAQALAPSVPGAAPPLPLPDATGEIALGDIALAWETCEREALDAGGPLADHVTHLIVHGLLHLLGYDHIRDPDATLMQRLEAQVLGTLGLDDPYRNSNGA